MAALPLCVLRRPVVVAVAHGVAGRSAPMAAGCAAIVTVPFALILLVCAYGVRRTLATRSPTGMRAAPPSASTR